jgi:hypothetical protein
MPFLATRATAVALLALALPLHAAGSRPVDYTRDVKPILSNYCYACHGPDQGKRKAGLRLDVRESVLKKAIKPGDAAGSELLDRVASKDDDEVMPPPKAKKGRLSAVQVDVLRRWVGEGAKFDVHWAYVKPVRHAPLQVTDPAWPRNAIDRFVASGQARHGLKPSSEADRVTLLRRLCFDLTGLPPAPMEAVAFLNDKDPKAYERLVDRLLASKHLGERLALYWLDLVRFADTAGYHSDNDRDVTLYRDWVINAFNDNMRFDRFTTEQIAGDLLPNRTTGQWVASGYNRLLMTTEEGGAQAKEYTAKYAADRVRNVSVVWLAGTLGCAECHDHKFDPYMTRDFYSMAAFFADVQETAVGRQAQTPLPTPEQAAKLKQLDARLVELKAELAKTTPERDAAQAQWEETTRRGDLKKLPKPVADALAVEPAKRTAQHKQVLAGHWRTLAPQLDVIRKASVAAQAERDGFAKLIPTALVSISGPPRTIRILARGNWLDDSGEIVTPAVPGFLRSREATARQSRLDLARWLVSPDNPLTARVFVNRLWKLCVGQGLVKSVEDFGNQGSPPTHPELLDWLAVEFIESGWDVKHVLRLMVTSSAYRQTSVASKEMRERDPSNHWLARQGRWRLDAEMVRDNALAVSGLLSRKIGGPSAKPYQPTGYWSFLNFPKRDYVADKGERLYRRGLYTFWQRTFPHPSLIAFDAPSREECTAERPRSSTPLQALVLLNDPIYVEAARVFAARIVREGGPSPEDRLKWAFRHTLMRDPRPEEVQLLTGLHAKHKNEYAGDAPAAKQLLAVGDMPAPAGVDVADLAAWTSVARVLLNLHETITRN